LQLDVGKRPRLWNRLFRTYLLDLAGSFSWSSVVVDVGVLASAALSIVAVRFFLVMGVSDSHLLCGALFVAKFVQAAQTHLTTTTTSTTTTTEAAHFQARPTVNPIVLTATPFQLSSPLHRNPRPNNRAPALALV